MPKAKDLITYGAVKVDDGRWHIRVDVYLRGRLVERNQNQMPWPTQSLAEKQAYQFAIEARDNWNPDLVILPA